MLDFGDPVCLDTHLPGPGGRGEELELPTGLEALTALRDREGGGGGGGEWEGVVYILSYIFCFMIQNVNTCICFREPINHIASIYSVGNVNNCMMILISYI